MAKACPKSPTTAKKPEKVKKNKKANGKADTNPSVEVTEVPAKTSKKEEKKEKKRRELEELEEKKRKDIEEKEEKKRKDIEEKEEKKRKDLSEKEEKKRKETEEKEEKKKKAKDKSKESKPNLIPTLSFGPASDSTGPSPLLSPASLSQSSLAAGVRKVKSSLETRVTRLREGEDPNPITLTTPASEPLSQADITTLVARYDYYTARLASSATGVCVGGAVSIAVPSGCVGVVLNVGFFWKYWRRLKELERLAASRGIPELGKLSNSTNTIITLAILTKIAITAVTFGHDDLIAVGTGFSEIFGSGAGDAIANATMGPVDGSVLQTLDSDLNGWYDNSVIDTITGVASAPQDWVQEALGVSQPTWESMGDGVGWEEVAAVGVAGQINAVELVLEGPLMKANVAAANAVNGGPGPGPPPKYVPMRASLSTRRKVNPVSGGEGQESEIKISLSVRRKTNPLTERREANAAAEEKSSAETTSFAPYSPDFTLDPAPAPRSASSSLIPGPSTSSSSLTPDWKPPLPRRSFTSQPASCIKRKPVPSPSSSPSLSPLPSPLSSISPSSPSSASSSPTPTQSCKPSPPPLPPRPDSTSPTHRATTWESKETHEHVTRNYGASDGGVGAEEGEQGLGLSHHAGPGWDEFFLGEAPPAYRP